MYKKLITPFKLLDKKTISILVLIQVVFFISVWQLTASGLYPQPTKIISNIFNFLQHNDFYNDLFVSLLLTCKAMLISIVIALIAGYSYSISFFKPIIEFISKCRYLTLTGLLFIFMLLTKGGTELKISVLVFGIVPFFVTSLISVINDIKVEEIDQCRTLRFTPWETLYEVIIIGKLDQALEIMRQNFAICWMMITMVESMSMSEGGIGVSLFKYSKYNDLNNVMALQVIIFIIGLLTDFLLKYLRMSFFPYTTLEKK